MNLNIIPTDLDDRKVAESIIEGAGFDIDVDAGYDPIVLLQLRAKDIKNACPKGVQSCICTNNLNEQITGPFDPDEDLLGAVYTYSVCNPGTCFCKDDPSTPKDTRAQAMKAVLDVCPPGEMSRCLCKDNKKVVFPFDYRTLFKDCMPKRVRGSFKAYLTLCDIFLIFSASVLAAIR